MPPKKSGNSKKRTKKASPQGKTEMSSQGNRAISKEKFSRMQKVKNTLRKHKDKIAAGAAAVTVTGIAAGGYSANIYYIKHKLGELYYKKEKKTGTDKEKIEKEIERLSLSLPKNEPIRLLYEEKKKIDIPGNSPRYENIKTIISEYEQIKKVEYLMKNRSKNVEQHIDDLVDEYIGLVDNYIKDDNNDKKYIIKSEEDEKIYEKVMDKIQNDTLKLFLTSQKTLKKEIISLYEDNISSIIRVIRVIKRI